MDATLVRYLESLDDEEYARELNEICEGLAFVIERRNFARSANLTGGRGMTYITHRNRLSPSPNWKVACGTRHWR